MGRCWNVGVAVAGAAALAGAAVGGCNRGRGILDPGGPARLPDGGVIGGATGSPDGAARGDAGAPSADAGGSHGDAGLPPSAACEQPPPSPPASPNLYNCGGFLSYIDDLATILNAFHVAPAADGQSYVRCGTLGADTGWQVTLSPDGSRLAALTSVGTVRLFDDTHYWSQIAQLVSPVGTMDAVAFSPDSATLATISSEMGAVMLWSAVDGTLTARFDGPPVPTVGHPSSALAFSSDGRRLATSLGTVIDLKTLVVTDWNGQPVSPSIPHPNPAVNTYANSSTYSLRFVGGCDQRLLVYGANAGGNAGWLNFAGLADPAGGAGAGLGSGLFGGIMSVVASPDGRWVAVIADGATDQAGPGIRLHDAATGALIGTDPTTIVTLLGFSPAGDRLYTVTALGEIQTRVVGDPLLRVISHLETTPSDGHAVAVAPGGEIIVSTASTSVWLDPVSGAVVRRALFPIDKPSYSADGRLGIASGQGALFRLWNESDASPRCAPPAPAAESASAGMALSPDGKTLALVDGRGIAELRAIDAVGTVGQPWAQIGTGLAPVFGYTTIAVANGGTRIAAQGLPTGTAPALQPEGMSRVVVMDVASANILVSRDVARANGGLALSPDGAWVAFQDGRDTSSTLLTLGVDTGDTALALSTGRPDSFSPDSKKLAMAAPDGMQIWDLASRARDTTYGMGVAPMRNFALSPDWSVMSGIVTVDPSSWNRYAALVWRPGDGRLVSQIGMVADFESPPRFDPSGAIMATTLFEAHTVGSSWYAPHVWSVATGTELRVFGTSVPVPNDLILYAGGDRLLTRVGTGVAIWCR